MDVERGGRHILISGMAMIMVGLLWGTVFNNTPYPRLALTAHIQLMLHGMLFILLAVLLLKLDHGVGPKSVRVMILSVWLAWVMAFSEIANAWWGTSQMLVIAGTQAGAPGALPWQEAFVKLVHIAASIPLIAAWALLMAGFIRKGSRSAA